MYSINSDRFPRNSVPTVLLPSLPLLQSPASKHMFVSWYLGLRMKISLFPKEKYCVAYKKIQSYQYTQ